MDRGCFVTSTSFLGADCYLDDRLDLNRAGFDYQGTWGTSNLVPIDLRLRIRRREWLSSMTSSSPSIPLTFLPLVGAQR